MEDAVTLTILPAEMNLAVDGKSLMQAFVGLFFREPNLPVL